MLINKRVLRAALCYGTPIIVDNMSYSTAMLIQSIIIKLTQPLVKATKMLMFQSHKIIKRLENPSTSSDMCFHPIRSYPRIVANSAFPSSVRSRTATARLRSAPCTPVPKRSIVAAGLPLLPLLPLLPGFPLMKIITDILHPQMGQRNHVIMIKIECTVDGSWACHTLEAGACSRSTSYHRK